MFALATSHGRADAKMALLLFIPQYLAATLECPVERLDVVVRNQLRAGRCLVLIDGLDEVTTPSDRRGVVASVARFAAVHLPRGNRFVCTSRVVGYASAPLPTDFTAVRLLEMDDASDRTLPSCVRSRNPEARRNTGRASCRRSRGVGNRSCVAASI